MKQIYGNRRNGCIVSIFRSFSRLKIRARCLKSANFASFLKFIKFIILTKSIIAFVFTSIFCIFFSTPIHSKEYNFNNICKTKFKEEDLDYLWKKSIKPYLSSNLWDKMYSYDAGHYLMVPMHASFYIKKIIG